MNPSELLQPLITKLDAWLEAGIEMLPNLAVAVLVLGLAWFVARYVGRGVAAGVQRFGHDTGDSQLPALLGAIARVATLSAGLFVALGLLHLDKTVTSLLAGVGVIGLALGFAFQDMATNFISGIMLAIKKPFVTGDVIEYGNEMGAVLSISLRETEFRRFSGEVVIVPNRKLLENELINVSKASSRRVDIAVGVAYDTDLDLAERTAREALESLESVLTDEGHEVQSLFTGFGASSIDMQVRFWVDYQHRPGDYLRLKSDGIKAIKRAFDDAGIGIPFPIRTLDIPRGATPLESERDDDRAQAA